MWNQIKKVAMQKTEGEYEAHLTVGDVEYDVKIGYAAYPGEMQTRDYPGSAPSLETWMISIQPEPSFEDRKALEDMVDNNDDIDDRIWQDIEDKAPSRY